MDPVNIRDVQHFLYCPHRWGLMEIDDAWAENYFVVRANLMHERVHKPNAYSSRGKTVYSSVSVWNDLPEYDLYGVTDCIEVARDGLCIVEYKPTAPKAESYREEDAIQVFAQKLCVDFVFGGNCCAEFYYADTKKRVAIPIDDLFATLDEKLRRALERMRAYRACGRIPPIPKGQKCGGCSLKDICMPSSKRRLGFRDRVALIMKEDEPCESC